MENFFEYVNDLSTKEDEECKTVKKGDFNVKN